MVQESFRLCCGRNFRAEFKKQIKLKISPLAVDI
jgi:hypothetical protein